MADSNIFKPIDPLAFQGPFSSALQPAQPAQQEQGPPVLASKPTSIGYVALQFMQGAARGRAQKYAREQGDRVQKLQTLQQWANTQISNPDLTPEGKKYILDQYSRVLGGELYQATGKGGKKKDSGDAAGGGAGQDGKGGVGITHHVTNALRDLAVGMTGGKMPKGAKDIDPTQAIGSIYSEISKPQYSVNGVVTQNVDALRNISKGLPPGSYQQDFLKAAAPHLEAIERVAPDRAKTIRQDYLGQFPPAPAPGSVEEARAQNQKMFAPGPPTAPQTTPQQQTPELPFTPVGGSSQVRPPQAQGPPQAVPGASPGAFLTPQQVGALKRVPGTVNGSDISFTDSSGKKQNVYGLEIDVPGRGMGWYTQGPDGNFSLVQAKGGIRKAGVGEQKPPQVETDIQAMHPEWTEDQVNKEAARLRIEIEKRKAEPPDKDTGKIKEYEDANRLLKEGTPEQKVAAKQWLDEQKQIAQGRAVTIIQKSQDLPGGANSMPEPGTGLDKLNPTQKEDVRLAYDWVRGTLTGSKGQKMANNVSRGLDMISEISGVPKEELQSRKVEREASIKDYNLLRRTNDAVEAFDNSLARHSKILIEARGKLPDGDVKLLNEALLSGAENFNFRGLSEVAVPYGVALQAVRNEYARVISGSALGSGQTRVDALKTASDVLSNGLNKKTIAATLKQMNLEVKQRTAGYADKIESLKNQIAAPMIPELGPQYGTKKPDMTYDPGTGQWK